MIYPYRPLLEIRCRQGLYYTCALTESCPEYAIRVLKHSILETNDNELAAFEPILDQSSNILSMRQI